MIAKLTPPLLIACIICSSLLNSGYFGNVSLTAYFGFCITTLIVSLLLYFQLLKNSNGIQLTKSFRHWGPLSIFLALTLYITGHGLLNHNFNLSHYYWLTAATLFLTVNYMIAADHSYIRLAGSKKSVFNSFSTYLHPLIVLLAIIESIVVISQWLGLFPSMNELFTATGTWVNPNITALFLALSLFSQKQVLSKRYKPSACATQLLVILLAIVLLQCRTAYVVAAILLLELIKPLIPHYKLPFVKPAAIVLFMLLLAFGFKTSSTDGRIQIWKNSLQLLSTHPLTGAGFGQFEKEYNSFVAQHNLPSNDYVYMPYNDFLELAVEGGIIAVALWITFLGSLILRFKRNSHVLALVISFIIIQLTNFGFQAIPVFVLFLIYLGCHLYSDEKISAVKKSPPVQFAFKPVLTVVIIAELFLFLKIFSIANAFHQTKLIREEYPPLEAIGKFQPLSATLAFSSNYHEGKGDLFMQTGNFYDAKLQYNQALTTTSRPDVLGKCGWCYGQLGQYDSAALYFEVIEKLQPYKYAPRMALLKLYEQKKDTASIKLKAQEIIAMPVKVPGAEVDRMKSEAGKWLEAKL